MILAPRRVETVRLFVRILRFNLNAEISEAAFLDWDREEMVPALTAFGLLEYRVFVSRSKSETRFSVVHIWPDKASFQRFGATGRIREIFESLARRNPAIVIDSKLFGRLFPDFTAQEYDQAYEFSRSPAIPLA